LATARRRGGRTSWRWRSTRRGFLKLGARRYLVISIVMVAGVVALDGGRIVEARLAVGACADRALRLRELEAELAGRRPGEVEPEPRHLAALSPIDDCRAEAEYRRDAALTLVRRLLAALGAA
jgi:CO/xanthine dehydrogenase FAD-binding subunit